MNRGKADLALGFNAVLWGVTFVVVKGALREISPVLFLALRFSLAAVALAAIFRWQSRGRSPVLPNGKVLAAGVVIGIFLFAGYLLQTVGLQYTTPPKSAFLTGLATVMVPLLGALVYRIKPRMVEIAGVLTATLGMALMTLEGPLGAIASVGRGDVLTFFGAVAFSAHIVATGHFAEQIGYKVLSLTQIGVAALASLSLFWWVETPRLQWHALTVCAILITGLLCTALAFTVQAWAQHYTTSTRTALIYALEPVVAWITSYCLMGEGLSRQGATGAALILGGVLIVEMKPFESRPHL